MRRRYPDWLAILPDPFTRLCRPVSDVMRPARIILENDECTIYGAVSIAWPLPDGQSLTIQKIGWPRNFADFRRNSAAYPVAGRIEYPR